MTTFNTPTESPLIIAVIDEVPQYLPRPVAQHQQLQGAGRYGKSIAGEVPRIYLEELARSAATAEARDRRVAQLLPNATTADHLTGTA
ncbi:hypothetical protein AB0H58_32405 [Nocardia neocaledoniensis]|uniref:hypothetical protein n=1 Tax=Nocardia neocaledoniensis TaxID=236511 RepID=UPI0033CCBA7A